MTVSRGIYFNQDNHHFYGFHPESDMTAEGLRRLVDVYADKSDVKGILFCVNVQRALFDSKVWEHFRDLPLEAREGEGLEQVANLRRLAADGIDQFEVWLKRCRELGIEGWLTMRMNDCHGLCQNANGDTAKGGMSIWASELWKSNPQLRRASYRFERSWEGAFDFGKAEVRKHHLALVEELFGRYDMHGLELDWMRWGMYFAPGFERENKALLTEFVGEIRKLADKAEARLGHPIKLAHRIPANPEACLNCGFDLIAWGRRGYADMVTLSSFLCGANFDLPIELWQAILPEGTVINAYVESIAESYPGNSSGSYEFLAGAAAAAWSAGADNLYLFNECYRESDNPELLKCLLRDLCSAERLQKLPRRLPVTFPQVSIAGDTPRTVLPVPLRQPKIGSAFSRMAENITVRLQAGKVAADGRCLLRLGFSKEVAKDALKEMPVRFNTAIVPRSKLPEYDGPVKGFKGGGLPPSVAFELVFEIKPELIHETFNAIEFVPPQIDGTLEWCELLLLP